MKYLYLFVRLLTFVLLYFFSEAHAQNNGLKFKHLSYREGLVQSPVSAIWQDDKGFIWIGNWKGLTRFDGYDFVSYKRKDGDTASISNNRVNFICQDQNKIFWIGTSNGLNRFDRRTGVFKQIDIRRTLKGGRNYISSIVNDDQGRLWVATFAGVKLFNPQTLKLDDLGGIDKALNDIAFTLFEDARHTIWVGTKHGVLHFDPAKRTLLPLASGIKNCGSLSSAKVLVIRQDRQNHIWFGTETNGAYEYDELNNTVITYKHQAGANSLLSDWLKDIYVRNNREIWFATRNGLCIYDKQSKLFINSVHDAFDKNSLNDNALWSITADKAGDIWIGTFAGGINISDPTYANFNNITESAGQKVGLNNPVANAIVPEGANLWVGTFGGGINYIDRKNGSTQSYSVQNTQQAESTNGIKSIADDHAGNLWIGTLAGLCKFNKASKQVKYYKLPAHEGKLSESLINAVLTDKDGVWAGTNGGGLQFLKYSGGFKSFSHSEHDKASLSDNFVTALIKDEQGNMWIGTQNGLNYYDARLDRFTDCYKKRGKYSLTTNSITSLMIDGDQTLWVGTEGGGLMCFDAKLKRFYRVASAGQQMDDVVRTILQDKNKNIWISTDYGIYRIDYQAKKAVSAYQGSHITKYTANEGLASNQFLSNAGVVMPDGEMVFGGINGVSSFYPERLIYNQIKPDVVFTDFMIRNKSVDPRLKDSPLKNEITDTHNIVLNYDQGFISIRYAALNFISKNNQYAYKLEGLENNDDWHYAAGQRVASYTNLEAGDYTFKVKAANNDGIWNNTPQTIHITVLPPWWKTWWAYLAYFVLFTTVSALVIRFFRARAKLKRDLFLEHRDNERNQELYQMKLDFFTNISHELRTPLTLISGPIDELISSTAHHTGVNTRLNDVKKNTDRLVRLVGELMDFRKAETGNLNLCVSPENIVSFTKEIFLAFEGLAKSKGINYRFVSSSEEIIVYFDKDQLEKVLFNLLSNAFKFTRAGGDISIAISEKNDNVTLSVSDTGKGIAAENVSKVFNNFFQGQDPQFNATGTGVGLALAKNIVELHHGHIGVQSTLESAGVEGATCFTITLKSGSNHFSASQLTHEVISTDNPVEYYLQSELSAITEEPVIPLVKKHTLLLVEDNPEVLDFLSRSLSAMYHIITAENGLLGLTAALDAIPDLIISDVMMPEMDGLDFCRKIKTDERTNHIPVILLTARAAYIHQLNGLETGADAYITKPFSTQLLHLNIRNLLASKDAIRQKFSRQIKLQPQDVVVDSPDDKFLQKLMTIVEGNIAEVDFSVTELADKIGMSKTVLYKKVNALTGMAVADFIKSLRLKKAAILLLKQQLTIAEIAFAVGFNDRKYFSKEFRKQFGHAPTAYVQAVNTPGIAADAGKLD